MGTSCGNEIADQRITACKCQPLEAAAPSQQSTLSQTSFTVPPASHPIHLDSCSHRQARQHHLSAHRRADRHHNDGEEVRAQRLCPLAGLTRSLSARSTRWLVHDSLPHRTTIDDDGWPLQNQSRGRPARRQAHRQLAPGCPGAYHLRRQEGAPDSVAANPMAITLVMASEPEVDKTRETRSDVGCTAVCQVVLSPGSPDVTRVWYDIETRWIHRP